LTPLAQAWGYPAVAAYCVVTAASLLVIHDVEKSVAPPVVTFYTFLAATAFFLLATARRIPDTLRVVAADRGGLVAINVTTAATWMTGFWAVKYLAPDLFLAIFMGVAPLATLLIRMAVLRAAAARKEAIAAALVTLAVVAVVVEHLVLAGLAAPAAGLALAVLSGTSFSFYLVYSRRMQALGPAQILSMRFFLLVAVALGVSVAGYDFAAESHRMDPWKAALIALGSAILPLYLLQTAITRLGAMRVANFVPFTVVVTYMAQQLAMPHPFSTVVFLTLVALCTLIAYSARVAEANHDR
jgi:drug/metabolite transporter (DMT)-like permease